MGTNYYAILNQCKYCKRGEKIHLGKSSVGWKFAFYWNDGQYYKTLAELVIFLADKEIIDEYGEVTPLDEFLMDVQARQSLLSHEAYGSRKIYRVGGYEFLDYDFS